MPAGAGQLYLERMACRDWDSQSNVIEQFHQVTGDCQHNGGVDELLTYSSGSTLSSPRPILAAGVAAIQAN